MSKKTHMARDQWGNYFHDLGPDPWKELKTRIGCKRACKMFIDSRDGTTSHIGYVVGKHWCEVFEVIPWRKRA